VRNPHLSLAYRARRRCRSRPATDSGAPSLADARCQSAARMVTSLAVERCFEARWSGGGLRGVRRSEDPALQRVRMVP